MNIKYAIAKLLNYIIPTNSKTIFFEPHKNGYTDKQDLINYSGDSVLTFVNYLEENRLLRSYKFYLVIYEKDRINTIKGYINKKNYKNIELIPHYDCFTGIKKTLNKIRYDIYKMRSKIWICATVHANKRYALNSQILICLGYFASFKSDYDDVEFDYLPKNWSLVCSTSMFDSVTKSAAFAIPYKCFKPLGLARNDYLFKKTVKEKEIRNWISSKTDKSYSKIIIYAPTFRDYEHDASEARNLWGYSDNSEIIRVLELSNAIVIAKMHSWQNLKAVDGSNERVIFYEPNFQFTIYDVMTIADVLITDYSSIGLDFMLTGKPVIYNLYDKDKYMETRGMCMEPIEEICGGDITCTQIELAQSIMSNLMGITNSEITNRVLKLFFTYKDGDSCKRIYEYLNNKGVFQ